MWHLGVSPSLPPSRHFFQRGNETERNPPPIPPHTPGGGREGGGKGQNPFAPLGEMGFIASTRRDGTFRLSSSFQSSSLPIVGMSLRKNTWRGRPGGTTTRVGLGGCWEGSEAQGG